MRGGERGNGPVAAGDGLEHVAFDGRRHHDLRNPDQHAMVCGHLRCLALEAPRALRRRQQVLPVETGDELHRLAAGPPVTVDRRPEQLRIGDLAPCRRAPPAIGRGDDDRLAPAPLVGGPHTGGFVFAARVAFAGEAACNRRPTVPHLVPRSRLLLAPSPKRQAHCFDRGSWIEVVGEQAR